MNKTLTEWDKRFIDLAHYISTWSRDPNRKIGAVIVGDDNTEKSVGYNGLPNNTDITNKKRYDKPQKYMWVEHAERNAIYTAGRNGVQLNGGKIYVTYFPCVDCARAIIQSGIKEVCSPKPDCKHHKWGESWKVSQEMFKECGVKIKFI
jgi:dCMP deaminase